MPGEDATWLNERDATGYDGPCLVGTIGISGMGWSVYDENGPAVTQKTWGQGPGGATALCRDSAWRVRRLSPWEALRPHSLLTGTVSMKLRASVNPAARPSGENGPHHQEHAGRFHAAS